MLFLFSPLIFLIPWHYCILQREPWFPGWTRDSKPSDWRKSRFIWICFLTTEYSVSWLYSRTDNLRISLHAPTWNFSLDPVYAVATRRWESPCCIPSLVGFFFSSSLRSEELWVTSSLLRWLTLDWFDSRLRLHRATKVIGFTEDKFPSSLWLFDFAIHVAVVTEFFLRHPWSAWYPIARVRCSWHGDGAHTIQCDSPPRMILSTITYMAYPKSQVDLDLFSLLLLFRYPE